MDWLSAVAAAREQRCPAVLVTVTQVRGHAPRAAGAKMVVSAEGSWDSIGGGNLEATAIQRARAMITRAGSAPESFTLNLSDRAPAEHGIQCCGGDVEVLLEPLPVVPAVAIFGMGHVGWELAHLLSRQALHLHLVDSRAGQIEAARVAALMALDGKAEIVAHHAPVPELVLGQVPADSHVLIMTHDHAEDLALCDSALRHPHLGQIGVIGSRAKWQRFRLRLAELGHSQLDIARITCPIGLAGIDGKEPELVALSVAADLAQRVAAAKDAALTSAMPIEQSQ